MSRRFNLWGLSMDELLARLHLAMADLFAGFAGGLVNAFVLRRSNPWEIVGSVVVGTLTAGYLGPVFGPFLAEHVFGVRDSSEAVVFVVGLAGMTICQSLMAALKRFRWTGTSPPQAENQDAH